MKLKVFWFKEISWGAGAAEAPPPETEKISLFSSKWAFLWHLRTSNPFKKFCPFYIFSHIFCSNQPILMHFLFVLKVVARFLNLRISVYLINSNTDSVNPYVKFHPFVLDSEHRVAFCSFNIFHPWFLLTGVKVQNKNTPSTFYFLL